jgi:adenosylhomocysteinase
MENRVYKVPEEIDHRVATMKLSAMGIKIDRLTEEQEAYLKGWGSTTTY